MVLLNQDQHLSSLALTDKPDCIAGGFVMWMHQLSSSGCCNATGWQPWLQSRTPHPSRCITCPKATPEHDDSAYELAKRQPWLQSRITNSSVCTSSLRRWALGSCPPQTSLLSSGCAGKAPQTAWWPSLMRAMPTILGAALSSLA